MWKIRKTIRRLDNPNELRSLRKSLFNLAFALALALKVTPKKLAKYLDQKTLDEYAQSLHDELLRLEDKEIKDLERSLKSDNKK